MEYVKGSVIYQQLPSKRKLKSGEISRYTKETYQIIIDEENIFQNQDKIIIMKETDFNNLYDHIHHFDALETKNNKLKFMINELKNKIRILEEYNRYLELDNKVNSKKYKSNYFTQ